MYICGVPSVKERRLKKAGHPRGMGGGGGKGSGWGVTSIPVADSY